MHSSRKRGYSRSETENNVDYKSKLEKKLMSAFDGAEPVLDLSDCNLDEVPPNIFPPVKKSRKTILNLQHNKLISLTNGGALEDLKYVKVLDLSVNKFQKLPNNLEVLRNLEVFDLSRNLLTEIPSSIGSIDRLVWLNLSSNDLRSLPDSIGNLKRLEVLNLRTNPHLKYIPPTVGRLSALIQLEIDPTVVYPPRDVYRQGIGAVLAFFNNELVDDTPSTSSKKSRVINNTSEWNSVEEQVRLHEKLKEEKQKQLLELEKQMTLTHKQEIELQHQLRERRQRLLEEVQQQQKAVDDELNKLQEKKDYERAILLKACLSDERRANEAVSKIISLNKKKQVHIFEAWECERRQEEAFLLNVAVHSKALERKKILVSMNDVMKPELDYLTRTSNARRAAAVQTIAAEVAQIDEELQKLLKKNDRNLKNLIETIQKNEELQKTAVAALLEKSDIATWALTQEIILVQQQLSDLTRIEMVRRKADAETHIEELTRSRLALTAILMQLFEQKLERRKHLIDTMRKMEHMRDYSRDGGETFWMEQYDKLLTARSNDMVLFLQSLHPELTREFFYNGVLHYLPLLKTIAISHDRLKALDHNSLLKLGIKLPEDRVGIMTAVENFLLYLQEEDLSDIDDLSDSELRESRSQFAQIGDCVVCLDAKPTVLFVSCGHICCCYKCFTSIALCPLCRKPIDKIWDIEEV